MKKKIHWLSSDPENLSKSFWQSEIPEFAEIELIEVPSDSESLRLRWKDLLKDSEGMLVDRESSAAVLQMIKGVPRRIGEIQCIDSMFKDAKKNWWPECYYREVLHAGIIKTAGDLDTSACAYITGEGSLMRVAMSVLVQLGYRKINLVLENPDEFDSLADTFKRQYFDTEVNFLRNTDLTLQKNDGTILINTMNLLSHPELKDDLTYLNFIFGAGLVVDTQGDQLGNPVLDEAVHVGLRVLRGSHLQALADWKVLNQIVGPLSLSQVDYEAKWTEFLKLRGKNEKPAEGPVTK